MKRLSIFVFLLVSLVSFGQVKRTINVKMAGTLPNLISNEEKYTIEELILTGELNGTDILLLREMSGSDYNGKSTEGKLSYLDMSGVTIVDGGAYRQVGNGPLYHQRVSSIDYLNNEVFISQANTIGKFAFSGALKLETVILPAGIVTINEMAFARCFNLKKVVMPTHLTTIEDYAFENCAFTSFTLPGTVTYFGTGVLDGCNSITDIKVESSNTVYDSRDNCNAIIKTSTHELLFGIKNTIIPSTVTSIADCAFLNGPTSIIIPSSVSFIGVRAFGQCDDLKTITVGRVNPAVFEKNAFVNQENATLIVPVGSISAYKGANYWKNFGTIMDSAGNTEDAGIIQFSDSKVKAVCVANWDTNHDGELSLSEAAAVTSLNNVFGGLSDPGYTSFNELQYFTGLTSITEDEFLNCSSLASVVLPPNITSIGAGAFTSCPLIQIQIPANVSYIATGGPYDINESTHAIMQQPAFNYSHLQNISVQSGNTTYKSYVGCNAVVENRILLFGCGNTFIPNNSQIVREIGQQAFRGVSFTKTAITLPDYFGAINRCAYAGSNITSINLDELSALKAIGSQAFDGCNGLTSITIPSSVTKIETAAFANCENLRRVESKSTSPIQLVSYDVFDGISDDAVLYVPTGTTAAYEDAGWNKTDPFGRKVFSQIIGDEGFVAPTAKQELVFTGEAQSLIAAGSLTTGTMLYSLDGSTYDMFIPQGTDAKEYTVFYKAITNVGNILVTPASFKVTIAPKAVSNPMITLSQTSYTYDGSAKEPTVTVKDGNATIPASEYAVSYSNNTNVGTATVTITDTDGGNYIVSGSTTFSITSADGSLIPPTGKGDLVYTGAAQNLITAGSSTTGTVQYSLDGTNYSTSIPQGTDAKEYTVYYKVVANAGYKSVDPSSFKVTISPKTVSSPAITLNQTSYTYDGSAKEPTVTVKDGNATIPASEYTISYTDNTNVGTATVTITDTDGGNYIVSGSATFSITEDGSSGETDQPAVPTGEMLPITIGKSGKASYCSSKSLDFSFSDEIKAYIATGFDETEGTIWLTRVKDVPAGTPVLIKGEANKTYDVPVTDSENSYYTNMFKGNISGATVQVNETDGDMVNYYLSGDGTFKSVKGYANIGNNKSYLQLPGTFAPAEAGATQTVKVGSAGKASFAAPVDLDFTNVEGLKAFSATGYDKSSKTIWLTRVMKVQKGEGVLLKGDAKDYEIPSAAVQSSYMNMFVGNTSGASVQVQETSADGAQTNFYLKGDGTFVSVNGYVNIGNNKCYLELPTDMLAGAASTRGAEANYILDEPEIIKLPINFRSLGNDGDGTTAIRETKQLRDDGAYYTLQGQRVVNPGEGLYIHNGKKVVIK